MYNENQFMIFSYHAVCDDWYATGTGDNRVVTTLPSSLQTPENTKLHKDAGFNVLFISYVFGHNGTAGNFETSKLKQVMDMAYAQGMKCLVFIDELHTLAGTAESLINVSKADGKNFFGTEVALKAYVASALREVKEHPAFYGVSLKDEPSYKMFKAQGEVYRAIKAVCPNAYVNLNLLPYSPEHITNGSMLYSADEQTLVATYGLEEGSKKAYKKYLQLFYDEVGSPIIQYDDYPIHERGSFESEEAESYILEYHLINAQIVAEFCKENGLQFSKVFQACGGGTSSKLWRKCTEADMYWQMNIGMAMGIKGYSYWSYYPVVNQGDEHYDETASMVNRNGEPNELYYIAQKINNEIQAMAPVLGNFEYQALKLYTKGTIPGDSAFVNRAENDGTIKGVNSVGLGKNGVVLATELYDKTFAQKGYWFVNVTDPVMNASQTVTVSFDGVDEIVVYKNGVSTKVALTNGTAVFALGCGEGVFVLPCR